MPSSKVFIDDRTFNIDEYIRILGVGVKLQTQMCANLENGFDMNKNPVMPTYINFKLLRI